MPLKTLLLNPPSFENFDGGASSRWPATREIESYWYPVWLTYPAGLLEGSRVLDAPPHHVSAPETINTCMQIARLSGRVVLIGIPSELSFPVDIHTAMAKELNIQTIKRSNHNGHAAIQLMQSGRIPESLVTHLLPLEQTPAAFEKIAAYADGVGKVVIEI